MTTHQGSRPPIPTTPSRPGYSEDTEVLTDDGFRLFQDLTDDSLVAQVTDASSPVTFIHPTERRVYQHNGPLLSYANTDNDFSLYLTPSTPLVYLHKDSTKPYSVQTEHLTGKTERFFMRTPSCLGKGEDYVLTPQEKLDLILMLSVNETVTSSGSTVYSLYTTDDGREHLYHALDTLGVSYLRTGEGCLRTCLLEEGYYHTPVKFNHKSSAYLCAAFKFIHKLMNNNPVLTLPEHVCNFLHSLATLCGAHAKLFKYRKGHQVLVFTQDSTTLCTRKTWYSVVIYNGWVHHICVPSGYVVIRHQGNTSVASALSF